MMSTAELRISTLAPVSRSAGSRSTIVIFAFGYARSRQDAKTLPAIPEPEMRTLSPDMVGGFEIIFEGCYGCRVAEILLALRGKQPHLYPFLSHAAALQNTIDNIWLYV